MVRSGRERELATSLEFKISLVEKELRLCIFLHELGLIASEFVRGAFVCRIQRWARTPGRRVLRERVFRRG